MNLQYPYLLYAFAFLLILFAESAEASCGHVTSIHRRVIQRRQESGNGTISEKKTVKISKFGYIGMQGPTQWASLSSENLACSTSSRQSPIDVTNSSTTLVDGSTLGITMVDVEAAEFENLGTTVEVVMEGKGAKMTLDGKDFELKQFHFHSISEHTIDGEYFPLEMHMVHEASDGSIAVIAPQFQLSDVAGETTELVKVVMSKIGDISTPGTVTETPALAFESFVASLQAQKLHTYTGSLTTPPCKEGLQFFITSQQLPLDVATFNSIKAVLRFNSRFVQNNLGSPNLLAVVPRDVVAANNGQPQGSSIVKISGGTHIGEIIPGISKVDLGSIEA